MIFFLSKLQSTRTLIHVNRYFYMDIDISILICIFAEKLTMKLYAVSQGEYSSYGISAIFDSQELAQLFIDSFSCTGDEMRIEPYELNKFETQIRQGFKPYKVFISKNGNAKVYMSDDSHHTMSDEIYWDYIHDLKLLYKIIGFNLIVYCFAKNKKHAIKIANDKRLQLLADNQWKIE